MMCCPEEGVAELLLTKKRNPNKQLRKLSKWYNKGHKNLGELSWKGTSLTQIRSGGAIAIFTGERIH